MVAKPLGIAIPSWPRIRKASISAAMKMSLSRARLLRFGEMFRTRDVDGKAGAAASGSCVVDTEDPRPAR